MLKYCRIEMYFQQISVGILFIFYNIYILNLMRAHRGKQFDWNKPFKTVFNKTEFDAMEVGENDLVVSLNSKELGPPPTIRKQQIIVPKIQIVRRITKPKPFAVISPNYVRITDKLNLPKLMSYELNEVDHVFLQGQANKFKFNGKPIITPQFLSSAFIQLELKAGKDHVLPRVKTWMLQFIEKEHKQLMSMPNVQQFAEVFYNYWKNRREELKFPMLRPLWRPSPEEYSHLLAFKPRQKDKRSLRRTSRIAEDQIAQDLEDQFALAAQMSERIKFREQLKIKQLQLNFTNFHNQCKQFFQSTIFSEFISPFDPDTRPKDKEKLRSYQQEVDVVKKEQIQEEKEQEFQLIAQQQTYDFKKTVNNYLSTVVIYAQIAGINYDKLFHGFNVGPSRDVKNQQSSLNISLAHKEPENDLISANIAEKPDCLQLTAYRDGDMIYRLLEQEESQINSQVQFSTEDREDENSRLSRNDKIKIKAPTSFSDYYTMLLKCYSFGEEEEGDFRDLRRITSQNFKKFQQIARS